MFCQNRLWVSARLIGIMLLGLSFYSTCQAAETNANDGNYSELQAVATQVEQYINEHLFDPDGLMYCYVDFKTGKPFTEDYIGKFKGSEHIPWNEHNRVKRDPVAYWAYEDTIATAGYYMQALVLKYEVTGDKKALEQAFNLWDRYKFIYYVSQVYGIGNFLRPYGGYTGGFENLQRWMEPLGTDQAGPLLTGQYALWKHAEGEKKQELEDIMVKTLTWYEQQGFRYVYYKTYLHPWREGDHSGSYYLPAIAFAARVTGDPKWKKLFDEKLPLVTGSGQKMMNVFKWGSDIAMLADLLGPEFGKAFPPELVASSYEEALKHLATFTLPGMSRPIGPGARWRPTELGFYYLCGLVAIGHPGAAEKAREVLSVQKKVPEDFTVFLSEDSDKVPHDAGFNQLQTRAAGRPMVVWYRNYWILRKATMPNQK